MATPNPQIDKNPAMARNKTVPMGTQMGLEMMSKGAKKMRPRTVAATVKPVRRRRIEPEMKSVRKPMSWAELGAWAWNLRRKELALRGGLGLEGR